MDGEGRVAIYKLICPGLFEDRIDASDAEEAIRKVRDEGAALSRAELWQRNKLIAVITIGSEDEFSQTT